MEVLTDFIAGIVVGLFFGLLISSIIYNHLLHKGGRGRALRDWRSKFRKYTGHECFVDGDKHDFRSVYNYTESNIIDNVECCAKKDHLYDICIWCGKKIENARREL